MRLLIDEHGPEIAGKFLLVLLGNHPARTDLSPKQRRDRTAARRAEQLLSQYDLNRERAVGVLSAMTTSSDTSATGLDLTGQLLKAHAVDACLCLMSLFTDEIPHFAGDVFSVLNDIVQHVDASFQLRLLARLCAIDAPTHVAARDGYFAFMGTLCHFCKPPHNIGARVLDVCVRGAAELLQMEGSLRVSRGAISIDDEEHTALEATMARICALRHIMTVVHHFMGGRPVVKRLTIIRFLETFHEVIASPLSSKSQQLVAIEGALMVRGVHREASDVYARQIEPDRRSMHAVVLSTLRRLVSTESRLPLLQVTALRYICVLANRLHHWKMLHDAPPMYSAAQRGLKKAPTSMAAVPLVDGFAELMATLLSVDVVPRDEVAAMTALVATRLNELTQLEAATMPDVPATTDPIELEEAGVAYGDLRLAHAGELRPLDRAHAVRLCTPTS
jgi:hypothetical protein